MEEDIVKNIRLIEGLKCELLHWIAYLFRALYSGPEKMIREALCNIIIFCYLLGNRLGISFKRMEQSINEQARLHLKEQSRQGKDLPEDDLLNFLRFREARWN